MGDQITARPVPLVQQNLLGTTDLFDLFLGLL